MAAISLCCPDCKAILKLAARPAEGKKVKCPKCAAIFVAADHEATDLSSAIKPSSNAKPAAKTKSVAATTKPLPKARPSRDDDDEDEAPRRRKSRADFDDDEDDDDDRPRRSRKTKKKSNVGLIVGLCLGGVFLLFSLLASVGWFVFSKVDKPQPVAVAPPPQVQPLAQPVNNNNPNPNPPGNAQAQPPAPPGPGFNGPGKAKQRPKRRPRPQPQPQPAQPQPVAPQADPQPQPVAPQADLPPVAGPVDLDKTLLAKTSQATAFIRVALGNQLATGSGFLVQSSGGTAYVITNYHVIDLEEKPKAQQPNGPGRRRMGPGRLPRMGFPRGPRGMRGLRGGAIPGSPAARQQQQQPKAKRIVTVVFNSGTPQEQSANAEVVATDPESDLAALRVSGGRNLPSALDVSQESPLAEQQPVYIFGFPANKRPAGPGNPPVNVGKGTIAGLRRNVNNEITDVHINGDVNPGNSGGPIVDANGRLVGIAVATVMGKQIGFAIPAGMLRQMFKGRLSNGLVAHFKLNGASINLRGEIWVHDHNGSVRARKALSVPLGNAPQGTRPPPANEYLILARLADPMLKIKSAKAYFAASENAPAQPGAGGWTMIPKATSLNLKIEDQSAIGEFKLPPRAVPDRMFAFQFSYVNADGKTIFTQPHLVRLTFPENTLSVTINVNGIPDEQTRRYIQDTAPKLLAGNGGKVRMVSRMKDKMTLEVDPVPDPNALKAKITFGEVTSVQGRTFEVSVKKIALPPPSAEEVNKALADLKSGNKKQRIAAADMLSKVYTILPDRRAEVAKALEPMAGDKDIWTAGPALRALALWGGPENAAAILPALDNNFVRGDAIKALASSKDAKVAEALAKLLPKGGARMAAENALIQMGPIAEDAAIAYVSHKDFWVRVAACHILKEIGTAKCLPALTQAFNDPQLRQTKQAAKEAYRAVQARSKKAVKR